jgi:23S rRNA (uracil1939-C5)-methyltransferase
VRRLIDGGYDLIEAQPIDLFPHTYHIETVALLRRADRAILGGDGEHG